jgi:hypothetical protein
VVGGVVGVGAVEGVVVLSVPQFTAVRTEFFGFHGASEHVVCRFIGYDVMATISGMAGIPRATIMLTTVTCPDGLLWRGMEPVNLWTSGDDFLTSCGDVDLERLHRQMERICLGETSEEERFALMEIGAVDERNPEFIAMSEGLVGNTVLSLLAFAVAHTYGGTHADRRPTAFRPSVFSRTVYFGHWVQSNTTNSMTCEYLVAREGDDVFRNLKFQVQFSGPASRRVNTDVFLPAGARFPVSTISFSSIEYGALKLKNFEFSYDRFRVLSFIVWRDYLDCTRILRQVGLTLNVLVDSVLDWDVRIKYAHADDRILCSLVNRLEMTMIISPYNASVDLFCSPRSGLLPVRFALTQVQLSRLSAYPPNGRPCHELLPGHPVTGLSFAELCVAEAPFWRQRQSTRGIPTLWETLKRPIS